MNGNVPVRESTRVSTGVKGLDKMLSGGLFASTMTTLIGSAGTGKTSLALQFLATGAKKGEKGIYFSFYETPGEIEDKASSISIEFGIFLKKKKVELIWRPPLENELDEIGHTILDAVKRTNAKRVVIDGMDGFKYSALGAERIHRFIPALMLELKKLGATIMLIEEISTFDGPDKRMIGELSAVNETVIFLHHEDVEDEILNAVTVLKMRYSAFDKMTRVLDITEEGIEVVDYVSPPAVIVSNSETVDQKNKKKKKTSSGKGKK